MNNMNHSDGWMNGWSGGGMWILTPIGIVVVVLLVVIVINQMKNSSVPGDAVNPTLNEGTNAKSQTKKET
jgi:uncharacterized membrane protein